MALTIDRTGLELSAGPLEFHLTRGLLGFSWQGWIEALLEWGHRGHLTGLGFDVWKDDRAGSYGASAPLALLSVQFGQRRDADCLPRTDRGWLPNHPHL